MTATPRKTVEAVEALKGLRFLRAGLSGRSSPPHILPRSGLAVMTVPCVDVVRKVAGEQKAWLVVRKCRANVQGVAAVIRLPSVLRGRVWCCKTEW